MHTQKSYNVFVSNKKAHTMQNKLQNKITKAQAQYAAMQAQTAQMRSVSYVAFKMAVAEEDAALAKLQKLQAQA